MKSHSVVWVLVCDGGRSQVLAGEGQQPALTQVPGSARTNDAPDPGADRHGERATGHASVGGGRYSVDEHADPRRGIEETFLREQIAWLAARTAEFDRLVIVAPPRALGQIRDHLPPDLAAKCVAEVVADLTKAPPADIARRVAEVLPSQLR